MEGGGMDASVSFTPAPTLARTLPVMVSHEGKDLP